jgi:hypothetical protein
MYKKFNYDFKKYSFHDTVGGIFGVKNLANLHLERCDLVPDYKLEFDNESKTDAHKIFYQNLDLIKSDFNQFVENEVSLHFDENFVYQKLPTFRIQWPDDQAIHYWHYDADEDHMHPDWEINFQLAITDMFDTNSTWVESVPGLKDFHPMEMKYGEYVVFDGNRCLHGNKTNTTGKTRVSFDFRVIPFSRYTPEKYKEVLSATKKNRFLVGDYYELFEKK